MEPEELSYRSHQLITYIGNKRALLTPIELALSHVKKRLDRPKLKMVDLFSGSGVVSRMFKAHASRLLSNDLEAYGAVLGRCFLANRSGVDLHRLEEVVYELNRCVEGVCLSRGFIAELYAPRDEDDIRPGDRVFYTPDNARRIDDYRRRIDEVSLEFRDMLLGSLLSKASIHANTAGVFKGFYKDRRTGVGRFGGSGDDALPRIRGIIKLEAPRLSQFECDVRVTQADANQLAPQLKGYDIAYLDPPYNQHPYGSNYFMLNLIANYQRPKAVSKVSGIPVDWQRSGYNVRARYSQLMSQLLDKLDVPFFLVAANDEGFLSSELMQELLAQIGRIQVFETRHPAFRGCRSFERRPIYVTERLFLVERS